MRVLTSVGATAAIAFAATVSACGTRIIDVPTTNPSPDAAADAETGAPPVIEPPSRLCPDGRPAIEGCEPAIEEPTPCRFPCLLGCDAEPCAQPRQISAGASHTCVALSDQTVACFGSERPALMEPDLAIEALPVERMDLAEEGYVKRLVSGRDAACTMLASDSNPTRLRCWGFAPTEPLAAFADESALDAAVAPVGSIIDVALGDLHACLLEERGRMWCAGALAGATVEPPPGEAFAPVELPFAVGAMATSAHGVCALPAVESWPGGELSLACVGDGVGPLRGSLLDANGKIALTLDAGARIAMGERHVCYAAFGAVRCFGANDRGQLNAPLPFEGVMWADAVRIAVPESVVQLEAGAAHTCALGASGTVYCWGDGRVGQLGPEREDAPDVPAMIPLPGRARMIAAGRNHTCALLSPNEVPDGPIWCWGEGSSGQTGLRGLDGDPGPIPVVFER